MKDIGRREQDQGNYTRQKKKKTHKTKQKQTKLISTRLLSVRGWQVSISRLPNSTDYLF